MRVTARNAEQKKPDLKSQARLPLLAQTPWGWKGSSIGDGRGTLGLQTRPNIISAKRPPALVSARQGGVGVKDACELAR